LLIEFLLRECLTQESFKLSILFNW